MNTQQDQIRLSHPTLAPPDAQKLSRQISRLKRLSPFLITCLFLPVFFIFWFVTEEGMFPKFFLCFKFLFAEANLAYLNLALWRYYERKRIIHIWLIELVCILLLTFLF